MSANFLSRTDNRPRYSAGSLNFRHNGGAVYRSSLGATYAMDTITSSFHTVDFDIPVGNITLTLPNRKIVGAGGLGQYSLVALVSSTVGHTLTFQTLNPDEYINAGLSTTYTYTTDGTRKFFMIVAPTAEQGGSVGDHWFIRHFGGESAELPIEYLVAGAGISIVEAPLGTYTVTNTAPNVLRTITAGPGIAVAGGDPNFTISTAGYYAQTSYFDPGLVREAVNYAVLGTRYSILRNTTAIVPTYLSSSGSFIQAGANNERIQWNGPISYCKISGHFSYSDGTPIISPATHRLQIIHNNGVDNVIASNEATRSSLSESMSHHVEIIRQLSPGDWVGLDIVSTINNTSLSLYYMNLEVQVL